MYSIKYIIVKLLRKLMNPPAINKSKIDKTAKCGIGCNVFHSHLGRYSYLGQYTTLSFTDIGAFCSISSGCTIGGGSHPMEWVAMSPVFQSTRIGPVKRKFSSHSYDPHKQTHIGNDVWIGANCLIKGGVNISDGAVVGMGSVVTHDIGPYEIWAGNPARMIRKRFDDDTINKLLELRWWNWADESLAKRARYMNNVESFIINSSKGNW